MPFFDNHDSNTYNIDFDKYTPIAVYSMTDTDGKITPIRFRIELPDCSKVTVDVDSVRQTKEYDDYVLFSCYAVLDGRKQLFEIVYYYAATLWCLRK